MILLRPSEEYPEYWELSGTDPRRRVFSREQQLPCINGGLLLLFGEDISDNKNTFHHNLRLSHAGAVQMAESIVEEGFYRRTFSELWEGESARGGMYGEILRRTEGAYRDRVMSLERGCFNAITRRGEHYQFSFMFSDVPYTSLTRLDKAEVDKNGLILNEREAHEMQRRLDRRVAEMLRRALEQAGDEERTGGEYREVLVADRGAVIDQRDGTVYRFDSLMGDDSRRPLRRRR